MSPLECSQIVFLGEFPKQSHELISLCKILDLGLSFHAFRVERQEVSTNLLAGLPEWGKAPQWPFFYSPIGLLCQIHTGTASAEWLSIGLALFSIGSLSRSTKLWWVPITMYPPMPASCHTPHVHPVVLTGPGKRQEGQMQCLICGQTARFALFFYFLIPEEAA